MPSGKLGIVVGLRGSRGAIRGHHYKSSGEEIYDTRLQIVHSTGDLNSAMRLHFGQYGTTLANVGHRQFRCIVPFSTLPGLARKKPRLMPSRRRRPIWRRLFMPPQS